MVQRVVLVDSSTAELYSLVAGGEMGHLLDCEQWGRVRGRETWTSPVFGPHKFFNIAVVEKVADC